MIPLICGTQSSQIQRHKTDGNQEPGWCGKRELLFNGYKFGKMKSSGDREVTAAQCESN